MGLTLLFSACADDGRSGSGPRIQLVTPDPVDPGAVLRIDGDGFGDGVRGDVSIGGRPVQAQTWSATQAHVVVPADLPGGQTYVVVTVAGRPSAPAPLLVTGEAGPIRPPRRFPGDDVGPGPDGGPRDGGLPPDASSTLVAEFLPDSVAGGGVRLRGAESEPGFLTLRVEGPAVAWGAAFHLTFDRNVLRFDEMLAPSASPQRHAAAIALDRLGFGRVFGDARASDWATFRFRVVGRGETRVDFPTRHRTMRGAPQQPLVVTWTGGTVRVVEGAP